MYRLLVLLPFVSCLSQAACKPPCRFAPLYTSKEIVKDPRPFIEDVLYWEGHFAQPGIGYNAANEMTYDGTLLDQKTGLASAYGAGRHNFSAASKESLHVMVLAKALAGDANAARFISPGSPSAAPDKAYKIMKQKLATYLAFNETYPGFGGLLPWYNNTYAAIEPTSDWINRIPVLDNGELLCAVYGAVHDLQRSSRPHHRKLGDQWQDWLDYASVNVAKMFYHGKGKVCAVANLKQALSPTDAKQNYSCEGTGVLDDPYEGELFTWWPYFFDGLDEYYKHGIGPITVQKGFWFSSHEQWKVLEMPYYDVDLVKRLYTNAERARTCNSAARQVPGEYASVNNVTDTYGEIIGYISNAGIPSIANQTEQGLDVVTPYAVFPTLLVEGKRDRAVGMTWWRNMVTGKKMQNPYGSTESERLDGTAVSSFVSWDSKITTVAALLGDVVDEVRQKMKVDGIYEEFLRVTEVGVCLCLNETRAD
ncbi:uncharacterized protein LTR77_009799 [Saxophila tyrrhenica]|uniref:Endo-beta-1,2-glucanase SGL domain-containing protein n=1 Tax=Saxophila tyrrhenica TaxID=1690608 RepID=A0AAV9NXX5_9PEZI|nr:hypothetical protein LTR77_009799 [Saxophila tyrrhenica]